MRVLVCVVPGYGHLLPALPTARALAKAGHEVKVATHASFHAVVQASGLVPVAAGMADDDMLEERRRRWPDTAGRPPSEWAVRMFAEIAAPLMRDDVTRVIDGWRPDLLIHDEGEYGSPVAAAGQRVPWVTCGWGSPLRPPAALRSLEAGVNDLWRSQSLEPEPLGGLYRFGVLDPCPVRLQPHVSEVPNRLPVRFEPYEPPGAPPGVPSVSGRPLAYVGFGTTSLYGDPPDVLPGVVRALLDEGLAVVATVSDLRLTDEVARMSPDVHVVPFVSLPNLMGKASLAVCHGGAGTTLTALENGVPLVIIPQGSPSQARMASACEAAGVGVVVETGASALDIREAVRSALAGKMKAQATVIADEVAEMPPARSVVADLETLAAQGVRGRLG